MKYIKTEGYYVYYHQTPDKMVYFGMSKQPPHLRWRPNQYKTTNFYQYIEKFGWRNINHIVIQDGLTKEQALKIEDWLIKKAQADGFCINKQGSGGWKNDIDKVRQTAKIRMRKVISTPAGKIYNRVKAYNMYHSDKVLITPLEAKEMYELTGYIPDFIKKSDLV